jgi:hypothetical protein
MKKIIAEFKTLPEIKKVKTIMKNVYSSKSDHLPDIIRFNLNKTFAPSLVEKAELHITTTSGVDVVNLSKASLTFFTGEYPFTKVSQTSEEEAKYTVLPWDIATSFGQDNLKNLINRIKENTQNLKYIIFVKTESGLNSSMTSLAGLNLSNIMAEDETESLLSKIEELELKLQKLNDLLKQAEKEIALQKQLVIQKQNEVNNFGYQLNNKQQEISSLNNKIIQLSKNEVSWDTRVKNQTSFEFVGFTGQLKTVINPINGTMSFNVI